MKSNNFDLSAARKCWADLENITKKELQKPGHFNIFSILRKDTDEEHLHSRFIGELLNPYGSHGLGTVFLKLFIDLIQEKLDKNGGGDRLNIDYQNEMINVFREFNIGEIDAEWTKGGKIDILLRINKTTGIAIENKITANDQKNQVQRYYNYLAEAGIINKIMIYLTLDGHDSSPVYNDSKKEIQYLRLSYKTDILKWLDACIAWLNTADTADNLKSAIQQYRQLVVTITNPPSNISKLLSDAFESSKKYFEAMVKDQLMSDNSMSDKITNIFWNYEVEDNIYYWVSFKDKNYDKFWLALQIYEHSSVYNVGLWAYQENINEFNIKQKGEDTVVYNNWIDWTSGQESLLSFEFSNFQKNYFFYNGKNIENIAQKTADIFRNYINNKFPFIQKTALNFRK